METLRPWWRRALDWLAGQGAPEIESQDEVDESVEEFLEAFANLVAAPPGPARFKGVFRDPQDVVQWIDDNAVPPSACFVVIEPDWDSEGNSAYLLYVCDDTDC